MKIGIASLQRYERAEGRIPGARQLLALIACAKKCGREDLVRIFQTAAQQSLAIPLSSFYYPKVRDLAFRSEHPDWYERESIEVLQRCLRGDDNYQDLTPGVISALALAIERRARLEDDPERAERFMSESRRRGYVHRHRKREKEK